MTTEELEKKIKTIDTVMKRSIANDAKIGVLSDLLNEILSDKNLLSEDFSGNMESVKEKIEAYIESTKESYEQEKAADKALKLTTPSTETAKHKDMLDKLKAKSESLNETMERIAAAKEAEMDSDMYIDVQKDMLEDLKSDRDQKEIDAKVARTPLDNLEKHPKYKEAQKASYTIEVFKKYNKAVKELATENAKPASEERDQKITEIKEKIEELKKEILSDNCVKYEETDKVEVNVGGTPTEKTFKELLDGNESIEKFLTGEINGGTKNNLNNIEKEEFEALRDEIRTNTSLSATKIILQNNGVDLTTDDLTQKELEKATKELKDKADKARNAYLVAKNKAKAKKKTIEIFEKDDKLLSDENMPVEDIWKKYVPKSERNSLISASNSFSGRFGFWRNQGSNVFGAFFKSFGKKNTVNTMKYVKTEEVKEAAKARRSSTENSFRKKLMQGVRGLTGKEVREVDKENAIKEAIQDEDKSR